MLQDADSGTHHEFGSRRMGSLMKRELGVDELAAALGFGVGELATGLPGQWRGECGYEWSVEPSSTQYLRHEPWGIGAMLEGIVIPPEWALPSEVSYPEYFDLVVAPALGTWPNPGTLEYELGEERQHIRFERGDTSSLAALAKAVQIAAEAKARMLRRCRYCRHLIVPEHRLSDDCCFGCGTREFGIVY